MVLSHGKSTTSQQRSSCEKLVRKEFVRHLIAFKMMKYSMQASYEKMVRIFGSRQNNRYYAQCLSRTIESIRSVASFSVRSETNGERPNEKAPRLPSNNTGYCQHEERSRSDSRVEKTSQLPRRSGPREARLAHMALSQLDMVLRGKPIFRFFTPHNGITKHQQKNMLRETKKHSLMLTCGKQFGGQRPDGRSRDRSGTTESEDFSPT